MSRQMKDSGIEWIGEIPESWDTKRMKSCISKRDSGAWGEEPDNTVGDTVCLRIADFDYSRFRFKNTLIEELTKRHYSEEQIINLKLNKGDILIEKSGGGEKTPVGRTVLFDKEYTALFANFMDRLTCSSIVSPQFMQYIFVSFYKNRYTMNYIKQTTGIQNLDLTTMLASEVVAIPPVSEQQKISAYLDRQCSLINSVIEKTKASIEEYKKLKQAVITQAVTKGVRGDRPMKDSGIEYIGKISEEWYAIKIKYIASISRGLFNHRPRNDERYYNGAYPFIQTGDVANASKYITTYSQTLNELGISVSKLFPKGTLTMTIAANVGDIAILGFDAYFPDSVVGIVPQNGILDNYIFYLLSSMKVVFIEKAVANAQLNLNVERIKDIFVPYTDNYEEQKEIADYLDKKCSEIDCLITKKEQFLTELESYKKSMIYEYVTGKKEVPQA